MKKIIIYIVLVLMILIAGFYVFNKDAQEEPAMAEITYVNASLDDIVPEFPFPGTVTGKQFKVMGKARGYWFFEASFPFQILDKDGKTLVSSFATAEDEWMTSEFVNFSVDVSIPENYVGPATLILTKDNPSDMQENDASISFPFTVEY